MRWSRLVKLAPLSMLVFVLCGGDSPLSKHELILRHRNLGKAFFENPTTQFKAVDEFRAALDLAPDSVRERINFGLALLRAGKTEDGIVQLEQAQKQDPSVPHTWFNLGIAFKKDSQYERAIEQFNGMLRVVPDEPVTHYNLGVLYKLTGNAELALQHFEASEKLNPNLAGPHFQLYNAYRQLGRPEDAAREQKVFQEIKKATAGAAVPEDLEWSFYSEIYEVIDPAQAIGDTYVPDLVFQTTRLGAGVDPASAGMVFADVAGDGHLDLLVWSSRGVQIFRQSGEAVRNCGLEGLTDVRSISPGDYNNDGLTDLAVVTKNGALLYENKGGRFEPSAWPLPRGHFTRALWIDYDHDYDLDLILLGQDAALARNNGTAGFSDETARFPFVHATASSATLMDLTPDTPGVDLVVSYAGHSSVLYVDKLGGKYEPRDLAALPQGATSLASMDFNNDGRTDLVAAVPGEIVLIENQREGFVPGAKLRGKPSITFADFGNRGHYDLATPSSIFRNLAAGRFEEKTPAALANAVLVAAADMDGDGRPDLAIVNQDGSIEILHNLTKIDNRWLDVRLTGVKNLKSAYEAKVELKAGALYQKQTYRDIPLHFGGAGYAAIDTIRITWPNGMVQNEMNLPTSQTVSIKEAPRLSGSCPMIFTWNGQRFEFITDVLGVAPLGASAADGKYFPVDPREYVGIPAQSLVSQDGYFQVRITEELHEVTYLDQVRLIAADHPSDIELYTNDKFKSPPFPEFRTFGVQRRVYPVMARDQLGHDVTARLAQRDGQYVDSFARANNGTAELHVLDLDFGQAAASNQALLILNGWIDWADGSTFLAAAQENLKGLILPYLQVKDQNGHWQTVVADMGLPAGKPKSIVVDLTGKFLSRSREVRIVTNLCVYWDEIFLSEDTAPNAVLHGLDLASADLHFHGFSQVRLDPERKQPEVFAYGEGAPVSNWNPTPGLYTRYGDVRELVDSLDDRLVIMGSGDEIAFRFRQDSLPPLRAGWTRDFLLFVDGWAKDADPNTAFSTSVDPLPYHGMTAYPYPMTEHFPSDVAHQDYQRLYNTRPALRLLRPLTE